MVLNKGETPDTAEAAAKLSKKGSYGRGAGLKKKEVDMPRLVIVPVLYFMRSRVDPVEKANNWTTSRSLPGQ